MVIVGPVLRECLRGPPPTIFFIKHSGSDEDEGDDRGDGHDLEPSWQLKHDDRQADERRDHQQGVAEIPGTLNT